MVDRENHMTRQPTRWTWYSRMSRPYWLPPDALALAAYFQATEAGSAISEMLLQQLRTPTLLMAGTRDLPRIGHSRTMASLMPNARIVELQGRTHGGTLFPAQSILESLLPFLRANP